MNDDILFKPDSETVLYQGEGLARPNDPLEDKAEWTRHLHCAESYVRGIAAMIERGADCQSVVRQIIAIQATLGEVTGLIVRHHLTVCLGELKRNTGMDAPTCELYLAEILALYQRCGRAWPPSNRKELL